TGTRTVNASAQHMATWPLAIIHSSKITGLLGGVLSTAKRAGTFYTLFCCILVIVDRASCSPSGVYYVGRWKMNVAAEGGCTCWSAQNGAVLAFRPQRRDRLVLLIFANSINYEDFSTFMLSILMVNIDDTGERLRLFTPVAFTLGWTSPPGPGAGYFFLQSPTNCGGQRQRAPASATRPAVLAGFVTICVHDIWHFLSRGGHVLGFQHHPHYGCHDLAYVRARPRVLRGSNMGKALESQLVKAAQVIEERLDSQIERLDNLKEDDIEQLRERRLRQMKEQAKQRGRMGVLRGGQEKPQSGVPFLPGQHIFDKHLAILAPRHVECKFIKLSVDKAPFLTQRLNIRVIPTLCIVRQEKTKDYIVGFDDLAGATTTSAREMLEWRLGRSEVIDYKGDLMNAQPDQQTAASGGKSGGGRLHSGSRQAEEGARRRR
uniref:Thioredoxin domain-containing protein n=1 Tax=Macrostomum lignano TaxID=282301 RepID=A0A1I8FBI5_9PLAT